MSATEAVVTLIARPSWGDLARRILALAAPTTLMSALQVAALLMETVIAARLGRSALAGWAVVLPFSLLLGQMSAGAMGGGVVSAIARALGAGKKEEASQLAVHALLIALGFAAMFVVLLAGLPGMLLPLIGGPEAAAAAVPYSIALFGLGAVPAWIANTLASVLRGGGKHPLAARVLNFAWISYPILAFFLSEFFGLGLVGIGLGFAISFTAAAVVMAKVVASGAAGFRLDLRVTLRWALFRRILAVGAVACFLAAVANMATILVTARLATYGPVAVAAYGVSARLEFMMIPLAFGVGSALTALVGRSVGQGDWETARRTAWVGGLMALGVCSTVGVSVALFPLAFADLFASDAEVAAIAARALGFIGPAFGGFGLGMAMYFAAMGAGRMGYPVAAGLSRLGIAVGGGWLLGDWLGFGMDGQFVAVALGVTAYGVLAAVAVRPGVWGPRSL